ncbi:MAG: DUF3089 domain-containing protein, partial [Bacteroidaceae bacterium]|nr:DUF3089 domain-containing protein [Bacteroidaceae bacterium]
GWSVTDDDLKEAPYIKPAQAEDDTGVVIAFDCEAEYVTSSLVVPGQRKVSQPPAVLAYVPALWPAVRSAPNQ